MKKKRTTKYVSAYVPRSVLTEKKYKIIATPSKKMLPKSHSVLSMTRYNLDEIMVKYDYVDKK